MSDLHTLHILPSQTAINSIADYRLEFEKPLFDYKKLLCDLKKALYELHFMYKYDHADWLRIRGIDYLANPKLFAHAPLTYLCAFLSEVFKHNKLSQIEKKISPSVFEAILKRLNEFK